MVYAGILLYIWRWQYTHPRLWMVLLAVMVLSHLARGERPRDLGLTLSGLRENAEKILPLVLAIYLPLVVYGFARHLLVPLVPRKPSLVWFTAYLSWCAAQQYLAQSYFHRRLMSVIENPHRRSLVVGLMFGATHIPNPILMVVTTVAGFVFAEVFAHHHHQIGVAVRRPISLDQRTEEVHLLDLGITGLGPRHCPSKVADHLLAINESDFGKIQGYFGHGQYALDCPSP